jgi:hypothetical protein
MLVRYHSLPHVCTGVQPMILQKTDASAETKEQLCATVKRKAVEGMQT